MLQASDFPSRQKIHPNISNHYGESHILFWFGNIYLWNVGNCFVTMSMSAKNLCISCQSLKMFEGIFGNIVSLMSLSGKSSRIPSPYCSSEKIIWRGDILDYIPSWFLMAYATLYSPVLHSTGHIFFPTPRTFWFFTAQDKHFPNDWFYWKKTCYPKVQKWHKTYVKLDLQTSKKTKSDIFRPKHFLSDHFYQKSLKNDQKCKHLVGRYVTGRSA